MSDVANWFAWVSENYSSLQEKYAGKYLAIYQKKVIAVGETSEEVHYKARLLLGDKVQILIEYIESGDLYAFEISIDTSIEKSSN